MHVICLLSGRSVSRLLDGGVLHNFVSALPGGIYFIVAFGFRSEYFSTGSPPTAGGASDGYSVLDCVYHPLDNTYYILDLMCWKVCVSLSLSLSPGLSKLFGDLLCVGLRSVRLYC